MTGRPPGGASPASFPPPDPSQGRVAWLPMPSVLSPKQAPSAVRPPGLQGQQGRGPWRTEALTLSPLFFLPGCLFEDGLCRPAETCVNGKCQPTVTPRLASLHAGVSRVDSCLILPSACRRWPRHLRH